jgi:hypothetical protein
MSSATPATRQLYACFRGQLPRDSRDVEDFFQEYSGQFTVKLLGRRDAAFINFRTVSEARKAQEKVNGRQRHKTICELRFNKPSETVCVASVPNDLSDEKAKEIVRLHFLKFGPLDREITLQSYGSQRDRGRSLLVTYQNEKAAIAAVSELQDKIDQATGWRWELEFHRVSSLRSVE